MLLEILNDETLHMIAEVSVIIVGSILIGILLGYLYWGSLKKEVLRTKNKLDLERDHSIELNHQLQQISTIRDQLVKELEDERNKRELQSKTLYDLNQKIYRTESKEQEQTKQIRRLNDIIQTYQARLAVIEAALIPKEETKPAEKNIPVVPLRAHYEHVSKLLGRQIIDNDLTVILGIGPRTSSLLLKSGIDSWDRLAETSKETLQSILQEAGGVYKTLDPTHWAQQAGMAAAGEWRRLRAFQESLKKPE